MASASAVDRMRDCILMQSIIDPFLGNAQTQVPGYLLGQYQPYST